MKSKIRVLFLIFYTLCLTACTSDDDQQLEVTITPQEINATSEDGIVYDIDVKSNQSITCEIENATSDEWWTKYSSSVGDKKKLYKIIVYSNNTGQERTSRAQIVINETDIRYVTIKQQAEDKASFALSTNALEIYTNNLKSSFDIVTAGSWEIIETPDWCAAEPQKGKGDKTVTITCKGNSTENPLTGKIKILHQGKTEEVDIKQWGEINAVMNFEQSGRLSTAIAEYKLTSKIKTLKIKGIISSQDISVLRDLYYITDLDMKEATLDAGSTTIPTATFYEHKNLKSITFPKGVKTIEASAFTSCGFTTLDLPEGIEVINSWAFASCSQMTSLILPKSLTDIHLFGFEHCSYLKSVTIKNAIPPVLHHRTALPANAYTYGVLYVPIGSKSKYKAAEYWSNFKNIQEKNM